MSANIDKKLLTSLMVMGSVVEARDAYTGGHLWRVGHFSRLLAEKIGLDRNQVFLAGLGGFMHDLGKVGVPDAILNKAGPLTDIEYAVIRTHPAIGASVLEEHPLAALALDAVIDHHERPDGKGYPHEVAMAKDKGGVKSVQLDEMVQFCMVVPMEAKPLPWNSKELAALTAYTAELQKRFRAPR